jgi:hypothetical protein
MIGKNSSSKDVLTERQLSNPELDPEDAEDADPANFAERWDNDRRLLRVELIWKLHSLN